MKRNKRTENTAERKIGNHMGDQTNNRVQIGDIAPDIELLNDQGELVKLSDFRGKRIVLYFYPKDDTKGCTTQACGFRDSYPQFEEHNALVIGVSPDDVNSHQKFKTKHILPFILLVDKEHKAAEAYGVWGERKMYGKTYMGIFRSHFVIDEAGKVVDRQIKVKPADSPRKSLDVLRNMANE
jgi:peroxiredoxin Q/BCP